MVKLDKMISPTFVFPYIIYKSIDRLFIIVVIMIVSDSLLQKIVTVEVVQGAVLKWFD